MLYRLDDIDFYMVTWPSVSKKDNISDVKDAVDAGCRIVQYREKNKNIEEMMDEAKKIKDICKNKAIFIVNDNLDVALKVDADGIHLGQDDTRIEVARKKLGKNKIIGQTVHNLEEAVNAEKKGADYIGVAPIFDTDTKKDSMSPIGVNIIKEIRNKTNIPIVAVGGITKENVKQVISMGADAAVSVSPVLYSDDVFREVRSFIGIIREAKT